MRDLLFVLNPKAMGQCVASGIGQLRLTDRQRDVCVLYYGRDMSQKEIGSRLGITRQAVSDHLLAARRQYPMLRKRYLGRRRMVRLDISLLAGALT